MDRHTIRMGKQSSDWRCPSVTCVGQMPLAVCATQSVTCARHCRKINVYQLHPLLARIRLVLVRLLLDVWRGGCRFESKKNKVQVESAVVSFSVSIECLKLGGGAFKLGSAGVEELAPPTAPP